jgi:hypothetical protein
VTRHLAVAVTAAYPDLRDDWPLLRAALADRGIEATTAVWTDPEVDWRRFDLVLANGAWDYIHHLDAFTAWAERVDGLTRLVNPARVLGWNADKHYLSQLAQAGVPIVPTAWVDEPDAIGALPAGTFVVKPTVSCGAYQSARYEGEADHEAARAHLRHLLAEGRRAMIQPYLTTVDQLGETGLIFVGGAYVHAINKAALLRPGVGATDGLAEQMVITATEATATEVAAAERVLAAASDLVGPLTYARVDLVRDEQGVPTLMELEVLDPALFFELHPPGATRLAEVLDALI